MEIKLAIPGMNENFEINKRLLQIMKDKPEIVHENYTIGAVYGNFQFCVWDGGRIFTQYHHDTLEHIQEVKQFYNDTMNCPIRFIFTNTEIKNEEQCYDRFCNLVLRECESPLNEIVVNSPVLEQYIRTNYPQYKIISSTTKCITDTTAAGDELNNNYYLTCLDYNLNHNTKFLESLSQEQKAKTEFLINAICPPACPTRKMHYKLNSLFHLNYGKPYNMTSCGITATPLYPDDKNQYTHISPEEIENYYAPLGFSYFKLEGRTFSPVHHLCNCVKYLIKPEYQLYVIATLTEGINNDIL